MSESESLTLTRFAALERAERIDAIREDSRGAVETLIVLGDECERLAAGEPSKAILLGESLAAIAREIGFLSASARALRATIPALAYSGQLTEALTRASEAQAVATIANDEVEHARARVASLHALAKLGRSEEAITIGLGARDTLLVAKRPELAARAELNLANLHKMRGEHAQALACLERALEGVPVTEASARGTIENTLGETCLQLDKFDDARAAFDRAELLLTALPLAHAVVLGNRADLLARAGRLGEALHDFERATQLVREIAPGHHARLLIESAEVLAALGAHREALDAIDAALVTAATKGLKAESARGLLVRARSLAAVDRALEAERDAANSLQLADDIGDARGLRAAALVLSELAFMRGDTANATAFATQAAINASPLEDARATLCAARACLAAGEPARALLAAKQSAAAAQALGVGVIEIDASLTAAACERALGQRDAAINTLTRAMQLTESVRGLLAADTHRVAFSASRLRVYEDLALELLAQPTPARLAQAFEAVEHARSRTLLDTMLHAIDRSREPLTGELAALRARLAIMHTTAARDISATGERRGLAPQLIESMRTLERDIDALITTNQTHRGVHSLFATPLNAPQALSALDEHDALIAFFAAGDELMAFVGMRGKLSCVRSLISVSDLEPLLQKYLFQLRAGLREDAGALPSRAITALSRTLYTALLAPLFAGRDDLRNATRLLIVPHGSLHALPFAALNDGTHYLIERYELQTAPSVSIACTRRESTECAASTCAVIGVADDAAPLITHEVDSVSSTLGCAALTGSAATRHAVRTAVHNARVVHFACHGRFIPSLPTASGLHLADGWMSIRDLFDLELNADLVFLSGCETGRHAIDAAEELTGVARAMLASGAARLVTTLWSVRDASAVRVATRFHASFSSGNRPSCALREAMLDSMRHSPHPSWWAPFVLTGVL